MPTAVDARLNEQCCKVYDAMNEAAQTRNADGVAVYRGYTTYLLEQCGYSISIYTPVMRRLRSMGCVQQKVRGGRGIPSEWLVIKPPTRAAFAQGGQRWMAQQERISDLEARVEILEARLEEVPEEAV